MSSVSQYIAFSSSRVSMLKGDEKGAQKFEQLRGEFRKLLSNKDSGWFHLEMLQEKGRMEEGYLKYGPSFKLKINALDFKIPFFGSTGFSSERNTPTIIGAYLGREPNRGNCVKFNNKRYEAFLNKVDEGYKAILGEGLNSYNSNAGYHNEEC